MHYQEIVFARSGESFTFDPPEGTAAVSPDPIVQVLDGDRRVYATVGGCRVDAVETTLDGDAQRGSKSIRVTSVEGIVPGRRYLMTKPEREREWIEVLAIRDSRLYLKHPLIHRYAGAATIMGCRISVGVEPAWSGVPAHLSDARPFRGLARYTLRWTYTLDGDERCGITFADLVSCRAEDVVTPADVDTRSPGWIGGLPPEHRASQGADFIAEAFRAVRLEALGDEHARRRIRDLQILRELVAMRAIVIRLEQDVMHGERRAAELAVAERRYRSCYTRLVELPTTIAAAQSSPAPVDETRPTRSVSDARRRIPKLTNH